MYEMSQEFMSVTKKKKSQSGQNLLEKGTRYRRQHLFSENVSPALAWRWLCEAVALETKPSNCRGW